MTHTSLIPAWDIALQEGWQAVDALGDTLPTGSYRTLVVVGMGGSGIAGHLLAAISLRCNGMPVVVVDGPEVPAQYGDDCLFVVCSYSGNTWETITAFDDLIQKECTVIALTSGGMLAARAHLHHCPLISLPVGHVPRAVLPWFMGSLFALTQHYGLLAGQMLRDEISVHWHAHGDVVQQEAIAQPFMQHLGEAQMCHVWGVRGDTDAVAYRIQTQLNENSKLGAVTSVFPELNHNLLVGFTPAAGHAPAMLVITDYCLPALTMAAQSLIEVLAQRGIALYKPALFGDTWLQQVAYSLWWADSVSYYVGSARGHAIAATVLIDQLKQTFSRKVAIHEEKPSS